MQTNLTKHFYELTPERILDAVEQCNFRCTGRSLALNSMENRVYEVEVEVNLPEVAKSPSDNFRVVKFYRPGRWSRDQILEEHQFLFELKELEVPVIAPIVYANESLFEIKDLGIMFAVFPKQGGRIPQELGTEELQRLGRLLARMHNAGAAKKACHRLQFIPDTIIKRNSEYLLDKWIPSEFRSQFSEITNSLYKTTSELYKGLQLQRIHGDCHLGNFLIGKDGLMILDFDDMVIGPTVQDLWLVCPGRDDEAILNREILVEAYQSMRSFDIRSFKLIEPLRAMRLIHFAAWIGNRWEDPSFKRTFINFDTNRYWQDLLFDIQECYSLVY